MARGDLKNLSPGVRAVALPAPDISCTRNSVARIFSLIFFLKLFSKFPFARKKFWVYHVRTFGSIAADMVHKAPLKIYARGVVSYFYFSRAPRARAENQANQKCHFKSSQWRIDPLGTDSCRNTVPMELPMSNGSMRHREPKNEIDDTPILLKNI
jgi:hypothetical protein